MYQMSTEYVSIPITVPAGTDVTGDLVDVAFVTPGSQPEAADWHAAEWVDGAARILVGPTGTANPGAGVWDVYVRVTDNPEIPVLRAPQRFPIT